MEVPRPVSMGRLSDSEIEALGPWVVVTAIHNEDRFNDGVAWYHACPSAQAWTALLGRIWYGGHYGAAIYPCLSETEANVLKDFLESRDRAAAERRRQHEELSADGVEEPAMLPAR